MYQFTYIVYTVWDIGHMLKILKYHGIPINVLAIKNYYPYNIPYYMVMSVDSKIFHIQTNIIKTINNFIIFIVKLLSKNYYPAFYIFIINAIAENTNNVKYFFFTTFYGTASIYELYYAYKFITLFII